MATPAEVRAASVVWRDENGKRQRAQWGQIVELPDDVYERHLEAGNVQVPGSAPLPGSKVEATPFAVPFDDGSGAVSGASPKPQATPNQPESATPDEAPAATEDLTTVEGLAAFITRTNPNEEATVALAGNDVETAKLVLAAEHAADGEPRKGTVAKLEKIIAGDGE